MNIECIKSGVTYFFFLFPFFINSVEQTMGPTIYIYRDVSTDRVV